MGIFPTSLWRRAGLRWVMLSLGLTAAAAVSGASLSDKDLLQAISSNVTANVAPLKTTVSGLDTEVQGLKGTVDRQASDIGSLNTSVAQLTTKLNNLPQPAAAPAPGPNVGEAVSNEFAAFSAATARRSDSNFARLNALFESQQRTIDATLSKSADTIAAAVGKEVHDHPPDLGAVESKFNQAIYVDYGILVLLLVSMGLTAAVFLRGRRVTSLSPNISEGVHKLQENLMREIKAIPKAAGAELPTGFADRLQQSVSSFERGLEKQAQAAAAAMSDNAGQVEALRSEIGKISEEMRGRFEEMRKALEVSLAEVAKLNARTPAGGENGPAVDPSATPMKTPAADVLSATLPAPFLSGNGLEEWQERIRQRIAAGDETAVHLYQKLGEFSTQVNRSADRKQLALLLHDIGQKAHAFWRSEPDATEEKVVEASTRWVEELNKYLAGKGSDVVLSMIYKGETFDINRMQSARSLTGNRFGVVQALSWVVLEQIGDATKVLHPALVVTQ